MRITNRKINATLTISHRFVAIKKQEGGEEGERAMIESWRDITV